jgi:hypothetical protein
MLDIHSVPAGTKTLKYTIQDEEGKWGSMSVTGLHNRRRTGGLYILFLGVVPTFFHTVYLINKPNM